VARVKVWAVAAEDAKTTTENSSTERFEPANVIDPPVALVNVTVAVPLLHDALVVAFVHVLDTDQDSDPNWMYEEALLMFTVPLTVTLPDVDVRAPPDIVRLAADSVKVPFAKTPPLRIRAFVTTMLLAGLTVPPLTPSAGNVL